MTLTLDLHLPRWAHADGDALFSPDRRYRYWLRRRWGAGPELMFVSCNPSDADERRDDQTTRRDKDFAEACGYHAMVLLNVSAAVMTDPRRLAELADAIGPDNDQHLDREAASHDIIVFAWGTHAEPVRARAVATRLWNIQRHRGGTVACLGWTLGGQPRHPSRLAKGTPLSTLTADAHPGFVDVDARWADLLTDTDVLAGPDSTAGVVSGSRRRPGESGDEQRPDRDNPADPRWRMVS